MVASAQAVVLPYVQGDTQPPLSFQVVGDDQVTPVDITGYSATLAYRISATRSVLINGVVSDPTHGRFSFTFGTNDLDTVGKFAAQITVISPSNGRQSWQNVYLQVAARAYTP